MIVGKLLTINSKVAASISNSASAVEPHSAPQTSVAPRGENSTPMYPCLGVP